MNYNGTVERRKAWCGFWTVKLRGKKAILSRNGIVRLNCGLVQILDCRFEREKGLVQSLSRDVSVRQ